MSENSADTSHDKDKKLGRLRIIRAIKVFSLIWVAFVIWATVFPDYLPVTQVQSKVYLFIFGWWPLAGFLYFAAAQSDWLLVLVERLMGKKPELRFQYIQENARFVEELDVWGMPLLNKIGIRWAAYFATRQQVPNHYSPRNRGNNFTYFWVCHEDTELEKFLPTLNGVRSGLNGIILPSESSRWPPGNMTEACLPYSRLGKPKIKIFRHYNETEIEFSSVWMYILSELTRFHKLKNQLESKREHREQRKFSRNFQFSSERMDILGKIVEWRRSKSKNEGRNALASDFSHIDFCDHVFSRRFFGLDDYNYYLDEVEFVLDSLVSSNDLTKHGARYRLTGNSISSLSSFEKEKEQASRAAKHDSAILRLTAILAFAALVSLCIQYNALNP